ncbi:hypothetical protein WA588_000159 [Blastocystis sp. NMH]
MNRQIKERKNKSVVCWDDEERVGQILSKKGHYIQQFGFSRNQKDFIYEEDVCYLLEKNAISLTEEGGSPLTDSVHGVRMPKNYSHLLYTVYRDLRNNSFKVYRPTNFRSSPCPQPSAEDSIHWIAYSPATVIHRSSPPPVEYSVHCVSSSSVVNSPDEWFHLLSLIEGGNFLVAVVDDDSSVSYYVYSDVSSLTTDAFRTLPS